MKLTTLAIENHARLIDLKIDVREHLVLVGANDAGKSSILRCLNLILGATTAQLYANITTSDFRDKNMPFAIEASLEEFNEEDKARFPDEIHVDEKTNAEVLTIRLSAQVDDSGNISISRSSVSGHTGRQLSREQVLGLGWKFLSANSQSRELREDRKSPLTEILAAVDLGPEKAEFETIAKLLESKLGDSEILGSLRGELASQLSKALPETLAKDDLVLVPGSSADDDVLSDVRMQVSRAGEPRDFTEQSDGMRALFSIAFYDLVSGAANVVGIDEPEVHLHPTSQRSLARLLKDRPNQKIIATHSSDIVSEFDPDSIVVVHSGGRVVQPTAGFLRAQEKLVANWWVHGRLEPLTSRRAIAVEGASDRIIVERAADVTDRNLDRLGISLIDAGSKTAMPLIEKLFGPSGFKVPLTILIDEDGEESSAKQHGVPATELSSRSIWVSRKDLENEYVRAIGAKEVWEALEASTLFSSQQLQKFGPNGPSGSYTVEDVTRLCKKEKVKAAIVVADLMTERLARKITSVENVLIDAVGH